ncbi:SIS domain-containing protein [Vibrio parahaemolyticus]|uniref:KpsF/GutQ family sugar-phosphate isomerase n=1 Tax=Vibrio parahaemolyticus TaxID=670 RepID=UPI0015B8DDA8|nr:SIS domain-containing protein [Vibrio parahaemolyticus]MBE4327657.1 SIS domain-containing protein [Vibrio parahaemolyticus]QLE27583.1 SIS domain-containing protein [Vibrio parahaemolyticus]HCE1882532.1 SIS domain-containing protein [Vibrio parahaemolyticus]HCE3647722.1 SIS domain-containing protein [Vibrio parahaemolyticus]HCE4537545.1 SIS domain-containing protein [Vibrio parahaemolyticus]
MEIIERVNYVLKEEAKAIQSVSVGGSYEDVVKLISKCPSKIVTTGIGKAGHIAHKFSATLSSTGTPSVFLHPAEAAHGDLGVVSPSDILIAFSTSGKSREVIEILELARHLGVTHIIGVTFHPDSELRQHCEHILDMGVHKEACPLDLTPTTTIAVMLAISDAIAISVMEVNGFTKEEYGLRHHGGYLGRKARTDNQPN